MIVRFALLAAFLAFVQGCAAWGPSEAECRGADWRARGYDDGYFGNPPQDLWLARSCGRFGIQPNRDAYLAGWRDGHDEWDRLMGSINMD